MSHSPLEQALTDFLQRLHPRLPSNPHPAAGNPPQPRPSSAAALRGSVHTIPPSPPKWKRTKPFPVHICTLHCSGRCSITGPMVKVPVCGWKLEKAARELGALRIAGLDEAGRGPMFGPVVAAAVVLPKRCRLLGLTDSKQLSKKQRNEFDIIIRAEAEAWAVAVVDVETIDRINIRKASLLAMRMAVEQILPAPDYLLIDGIDKIDWPCPQQPVVKGDSTSYSIAAASVLAKVHRDRLMVELDAVYPGYGLARHKGYCSREHFEALARLGPTALHRKSFQPVAQAALQFPES